MLKTMVIFSATADQFRFHANEAIKNAGPAIEKCKFDRTAHKLEIGEWKYILIRRPEEMNGLVIDGFTTWGDPPPNIEELEQKALTRFPPYSPEVT